MATSMGLRNQGCSPMPAGIGASSRLVSARATRRSRAHHADLLPDLVAPGPAVTATDDDEGARIFDRPGTEVPWPWMAVPSTKLTPRATVRPSTSTGTGSSRLHHGAITYEPHMNGSPRVRRRVIRAQQQLVPERPQPVQPLAPMPGSTTASSSSPPMRTSATASLVPSTATISLARRASWTRQGTSVMARSDRSRNGGSSAGMFEKGSTSQGWRSMPSASRMKLRRPSMRVQASG